MAFIPVPQACQVEMIMSLGDQVIENTFGVRVDTPIDETAIEALANFAVQQWSDNIMPLLSEQAVLTAVEVTDLSSPTAASTRLAVIPNITGGDSVRPSPNNVALCVSFYTVGRGRSSRGRNYISGIPENQVVDNRVNAFWVQSLVSAYMIIRQAFLDNQTPMVVISRYANKNPRPQGVISTILSMDVTDNVVDSQRRRLPGRGK